MKQLSLKMKTERDTSMIVAMCKDIITHVDSLVKCDKCKKSVDSKHMTSLSLYGDDVPICFDCVKEIISNIDKPKTKPKPRAKKHAKPAAIERQEPKTTDTKEKSDEDLPEKIILENKPVIKNHHRTTIREAFEAEVDLGESISINGLCNSIIKDNMDISRDYVKKELQDLLKRHNDLMKI